MSLLVKKIYFANDNHNENYQEFENWIIMDFVDRLKEFKDNEARSCSMDFGCITPIYAYRMWGGQVSIEVIENGLTEILKQGSLG